MLVCWCCLHSVAADPVVMLMRMYLGLLQSCANFSPSSMSMSVAAALSSASVSPVVVASVRVSRVGKMLS